MGRKYRFGYWTKERPKGETCRQHDVLDAKLPNPNPNPYLRLRTRLDVAATYRAAFGRLPECRTIRSPQHADVGDLSVDAAVRQLDTGGSLQCSTSSDTQHEQFTDQPLVSSTSQPHHITASVEENKVDHFRSDNKMAL